MPTDSTPTEMVVLPPMTREEAQGLADVAAAWLFVDGVSPHVKTGAAKLRAALDGEGEPEPKALGALAVGALMEAGRALRYISGEDVPGMDAHMRPADVASAALESIHRLFPGQPPAPEPGGEGGDADHSDDVLDAAVKRFEQVVEAERLVRVAKPVPTQLFAPEPGGEDDRVLLAARKIVNELVPAGVTNRLPDTPTTRELLADLEHAIAPRPEPTKEDASSVDPEMDPRPGFLQRSLDRARKNIEARPDRLKPERYRRTTGEGSNDA